MTILSKSVNRSLEALIDDSSFEVRNTVIDGGVVGPGKVIDNAGFHLSFWQHSAKWGAAKIGQWWQWKWALGMAKCTK